jgi:hypothetical protein
MASPPQQELNLVARQRRPQNSAVVRHAWNVCPHPRPCRYSYSCCGWTLDGPLGRPRRNHLQPLPIAALDWCVSGEVWAARYIYFCVEMCSFACGHVLDF